MKTIPFFLHIGFLSLILLASACNGQDDNNGITVGGDCSASWKVNGTSYSEDNLALCTYLDNTLNLNASIGGGLFLFQIDPITSTGTYTADISNPDLNVFIQVELNDGTRIGSATAEVIVTQLSNNKAKGTFSGDFFDIMDFNQALDFTVTEGVFEANF